MAYRSFHVTAIVGIKTQRPSQEAGNDCVLIFAHCLTALKCKNKIKNNSALLPSMGQTMNGKPSGSRERLGYSCPIKNYGI